MSFKFDLIENINIEDSSTWKNKIFLTFDVDWAHDDIWLKTIELLENYDVPATWFITHDSNLISRIIKNKKFRIGIHPNFNKLIDIKDSTKSVTKIISEFSNFLPKTRLVRSHCLLQSELLLDVFLAHGYDYVCNSFIPLSKNQVLAPWYLWNNIPQSINDKFSSIKFKDHIKVIPHCWQDNVSLKMNLSLPKTNFLNQLIVMNFHPIHVYLNTDSLIRYENSRKYHRNPNELKQFVNNKFGIESILLEYLEK